MLRGWVLCIRRVCVHVFKLNVTQSCYETHIEYIKSPELVIISRIYAYIQNDTPMYIFLVITFLCMPLITSQLPR